MLADVLETFRRWVYLPDPAALYATLATVAANRWEGHDPLWLALVGPPGGGKSEILRSLYGIKDVRPAADMTLASLLSGTPAKDRSSESKGGILREIGSEKPGIIVCKDFTTVLSMHADTRQRLLGALREIYDGAYHRDVGVDGGKRLQWYGKVGMIVGVTGTIDSHHGVMASMGERLMLLRLPRVDEEKLTEKAWEQQGSEEKMRAELTKAVHGFLKDSPGPPEPTSQEQGIEMQRLARVVARCRSSVERHNYTRDIELIPDPEAPTRLVGQLDRLYCGLRAIGVSTDESWAITAKVGIDCIPALRRLCIFAFLDQPAVSIHGEQGLTLKQIAAHVRHPEQTTRRALQDLIAHNVVHQHMDGQTHLFSLDPWVVERFQALSAERVAA